MYAPSRTQTNIQSRLTGAVLLCAAAGLLPFQAAAQTSAGASSTRPAAKRSDSGSDEWHWTTPTARDTMTWVGGANQADTNRYGARRTTETKFAFPGARGKTMTGFRYNDGPGDNGSTASCAGGGSSAVVAGRLGNYHEAFWNVAVGGALGRGQGAFWLANARANDPYWITPDDLDDAGVDGTEYDFYIGAGLETETVLSANGEVELTVWYDTAGESTLLLRLVGHGTDGAIAVSEVPDLEFYLFDSHGDGPPTDEDQSITLEELKTLLESDLIADRTLDNPLYIGIVWEDIPVPTVDMGNGAVARTRVETDATDSAAQGGNPNHFVPWTDDFDLYEPGQPLVPQSSWDWYNNNQQFDAIVAPTGQSPPNALDVGGNANVLHQWVNCDDNVWHFQCWQLIPGDYQSGGGQDPGSSIFLFDVYQHNGPQHPGAGMRLDSNDQQLKVFTGTGNQTVEVPYIVDQWVPIDVIVDLDNDHCQVFYDSQFITEYQWTAGAFGDGQGQPQIAAVDLWARGSSPIFYDDMILVELEPEPATLRRLTVEDGTIIAGSINDLDDSDDQYLSIEAKVTGEVAQPHLINFTLRAQTNEPSTEQIDLRYESRITDIESSVWLSLFDWQANEFVDVASFTIGLNEQRQEASVPDAARFVREDNGAIRLHAKSIVFMPFTLGGFHAHIDQISIIPRRD